MTLKHYIPKDGINSRVSYKLLSENNTVIKDYEDLSCFAYVTYHAIHFNCKKIVVYRDKNLIPYNYDVMERWIKELNQMGFPCQIQDDGEKVNFIIILADYEYKIHLNITLQLIRYLFEIYICYAPEYYFKLIEKFPKRNKFLLLQKASRDLGNYDCSRYFNSNHTITWRGNGRCVTYEEFLKRMKETQKPGVYTDKVGWISALFRGESKKAKELCTL